jgi:hypothetical protein
LLIAGPGGVAICTECGPLQRDHRGCAGAGVHTAAGPGSASPGCVIALDGTTTSLEGRERRFRGLLNLSSKQVPG